MGGHETKSDQRFRSTSHVNLNFSHDPLPSKLAIWIYQHQDLSYPHLALLLLFFSLKWVITGFPHADPMANRDCRFHPQPWVKPLSGHNTSTYIDGRIWTRVDFVIPLSFKPWGPPACTSTDPLGHKVNSQTIPCATMKLLIVFCFLLLVFNKQLHGKKNFWWAFWFLWGSNFQQ